VAYLRAKTINGHGPYWYEVRSVSTPGGPRQVHVRYIGKLWGYKVRKQLRAEEGKPDEVRDYIDSFQEALFDTVTLLRATFRQEAEATGRLKLKESVEEKMQRKNYPLSKIQDIAGTRVSFRSIRTQKNAVAEMKEVFLVKRVDNFLSEERPDGYRGIHLDIENKGRIVEVQLRTARQNRWSDWSHKYIYERYAKKNKPAPVEVLDYARAMSNYFYELDCGRKAKHPRFPEKVKEFGVEELK